MNRPFIRDYRQQTANEDAAAWSRLHRLPYVVISLGDGQYEAREQSINNSNYYERTGPILAKFENGVLVA